MRHPLVARIVDAYEARAARRPRARRAAAASCRVQSRQRARGVPARRGGCARWARAAPARRRRRHAAHRRRRARPQRSTARYRGKDYATNVLTFVYDEAARACSGDIVLCAPVVRARRASRARRCAATTPTSSVHGMLHLQGYDHERRRRRRAHGGGASDAILRRLGFADPYVLPTGRCASRGRMELASTGAPRMNDPPKPSLLERLSALLLREPEDRDQLIALLHSALRAQPARRRRAVDDRGRAAGVRDAGARHHDPARADGRHRHQRAGRELHSARDRDRALALPGHRREPRRRDRHPAGQGPAALLRRRGGVQRARHAAPRGVRARIEARSTCCCASSAPTAITWRSSSTSTAASRAWSPSRTCSSRSSATSRTSTTSTRRTTTSSREPSGRYRVKALTEIADFNAAFGTALPGRRARHRRRAGDRRSSGACPSAATRLTVEGLRFQVLRADSRRVHTLIVEKAN